MHSVICIGSAETIGIYHDGYYSVGTNKITFLVFHKSRNVRANAPPAMN